MKARCYNPNIPNYHNYGGRGIRVCPRWVNSFRYFIEDMGPRPFPGATLNRIDNNGNYEPGNCNWISNQEQCRNRRGLHPVTINGVTRLFTEWCKLSGISHPTALKRIEYGWPVEKAFSFPRRVRRKPHNTFLTNNQKMEILSLVDKGTTYSEICKLYGVGLSTVWKLRSLRRIKE